MMRVAHRGAVPEPGYDVTGDDAGVVLQYFG